MNAKDKVFLEAVRYSYQKGRDKAPGFLEREGATVIDLLHALVLPNNNTAEEILVDAGAIAWCLEQLENER